MLCKLLRPMMNRMWNIYIILTTGIYLGLSIKATAAMCTVDLKKRLQPDDIGINGDYDDYLEHYNSSLCLRPCKIGEPPRVCYYKFNIENYNTIGKACGNCSTEREDCLKPQCVTADGYERAILTVNRRLPGPSIQVCRGDMIVVDVINKILGSTETMHWHGIRQTKTPWMDGVPMVTQCPIHQGSTFRYSFPAEDPGSFWYHSHSGLHKFDGLVGSLIVRQPDSKEPLLRLYDFDLPSHSIVVQEWKHVNNIDLTPGLVQRNIVAVDPDSYLINGRGIYMRNMTDFVGVRNPPITVFQVESGRRYRFRIIAATSLFCLFRITVQSHRLLVIAIDRNPIEPIIVDAIEMASGERYDVVIEANQPIDVYYILVQGLTSCSMTSQLGVLQYRGSTLPTTLPSSTSIPSSATAYVLNPRNSSCSNATLATQVCVSQLSGLMPTPPKVRKREPDIRLVLQFGFHIFSDEELFENNTYIKHYYISPNYGLISLINNISFSLPASPLLTQFRDIPPSKLCNSCDQQFCECTYLIKIPLGSVVEILMVNTLSLPVNRQAHPFHLHGYDFYILEQGSLNTSLAEIQKHLRRRGPIRNYLPSKDTVIVTAAGYTVARILADNPGFWFYHCHINIHLSFGMAAVFQVGELSDMLHPPKNFPRCNEFIPPVECL